MGAAGAGKTTLAVALAERLAYRHVEIDDIYWLPSEPRFQAKRDVGERIRLLTGILQDEGIVLSGSLSGWGDPLVPVLDGVVWVQTPTDVRLERLRRRERKRYGDAIDAGGPLHEQHLAFLSWAAAYDGGSQPGRSHARDDAWLTGLPCATLMLDGTQAVEAQVEAVIRWATAA